MDDKIGHLPGANTDDLAAALATVERDFHKIIAQATMIAKVRRTLYDAYLKQGFSTYQALELSKCGLNI